ncbi:MAG: bifunctional pyr operon transcriptional regulator/uracil phosphoribosyltransferase PyrR [Erysipelotrichales bacterium]|nr:bifunctional pyr operon transcriptional regulator/uracil phosphoribosyltransferase PyrR [Erysipelotrichales bacterium]
MAEKETVIMDEAGIMRSLARIAHEIVERNHGTENLVLAGIKRRGVPLAEILAANIEKFEGVKVPVGKIDIAMYRDDLTKISDDPYTGGCEMPCDITGKTVVITDDVIYTGRTVRAAMEALFSIGRPKRIQLAELVDRGHRELPIKPDYVGKNVPTSHEEIVQVMVEYYDGENKVLIVRNG